MPTPRKRPVVVTTEHRGVFFGFTTQSPDVKTISLTDAQMCVYWAQDVQGVLGLASSGPSKLCRITHPIPKITIQAVTAVLETTSEAVKAWQTRPWR